MKLRLKLGDVDFQLEMGVFIDEFLQDYARRAKQIRTFMNSLVDTAEYFVVAR